MPLEIPRFQKDAFESSLRNMTALRRAMCNTEHEEFKSVFRGRAHKISGMYNRALDDVKERLTKLFINMQEEIKSRDYVPGNDIERMKQVRKEAADRILDEVFILGEEMRIARMYSSMLKEQCRVGSFKEFRAGFMPLQPRVAAALKFPNKYSEYELRLMARESYKCGIEIQNEMIEPVMRFMHEIMIQNREAEQSIN